MKKQNLLFLLLMVFFACQMYAAQSFTLSTCFTGISTNTYGPMSSTTTANDKNRMAFILPASQLVNIANGTITSTYFKRLTAAGTLNATTTFKIYLKNTSAIDFGSGSPDWAAEVGTATLVYDSSPAVAVGSSAGFKQFQHAVNFVYDSGSNLAVYLEYVQTTAQTANIQWDYEYGSSCINTSNSNTTKYVKTSGAFGATLTSSNYRRPVIAFDVTVPPPTAAPSCTTVSAPANNATAVSVTPTFAWASTASTSSYTISVGTAPGGTNVMNNVDVGNVTNYAVPAASPLAYSTQYYLTVTPKNAIGSATGCTSTAFTTTTIPCPSVSVPAVDATGVSLTPTFTWAAAPQATGYRLRVGTAAGGTDIVNNLDLGNVTTYTLPTPLAASTKYYYSVSSYSASSNSATCTERNFTTLCTNAIATLPWTENFDTLSNIGVGIVPTCWSAVAGTTNWTSMNTSSTIYNAPKSAPNYMTIPYGNTVASQLWTPGFALTAGTAYEFSFYYNTNGTSSSYTGFTGDVQVNSTPSMNGAASLGSLISSTQGTTSYTRYKVIYTPVATGNYYFAVNVSSTSSPWHLGVDDFKMQIAPTCSEPSNIMAANITTSSADISWTAPSVAPANGYDLYYSTSSTAPTSVTVPNYTAISGTSQSLSGLTASLPYYVWVRSRCSSDQSIWDGPYVLTLLVTNDNCASPLPLTVGTDFASSAVNTSNVGATSDGTASCMVSASDVNNNVWYSVVIPASGNVIIETAAVAGSPFVDSVMEVYSGTCGNFTSLGCNDDTNLTSSRFSKVTLTGQTPGSTVYVSVWKYSSSNNLDGQFQISAYDASNLATSEVSAAKNAIKVYPNPFEDVLNISDISKVKSASVTDMAGKLVKTIANPSAILQLSGLNSGMYLITLELRDGSKQTVKVIKK
ncbi:T9SS type A sorting domain-containing protein [Chryseobacterium fluminis]|uniref:T9SS type A sorting domain-containing protein n=1 Tax=Chryseobacterium fluminis TaxID=2983606 RepID=UPI0022514EEF|nr:T9SS type A sorting domain-containing protein [Chryseobacterium sp. MMS21-Ot14]UZT97624.1 T9SS type A sorting domain-containing protein [Chryseobacterium sp. MMS21-Ot14]